MTRPAGCEGRRSSRPGSNHPRLSGSRRGDVRQALDGGGGRQIASGGGRSIRVGHRRGDVAIITTPGGNPRKHWPDAVYRRSVIGRWGHGSFLRHFHVRPPPPRALAGRCFQSPHQSFGSVHGQTVTALASSPGSISKTARGACRLHCPSCPSCRQNAQPSHVIVSSVVSVNRYLLAHAAQNRRICGVHAGLVAGDQLRQGPGRECRSRERRTGYYRTPRLCSRCSTAARIWSVSHAVQSSVSGSPGTPVFRPEATNLTARCCEPYLSHRARNRIVKATDGSSFTVRTS